MILQSPPKEIKGLYFALYCGTLDLLASSAWSVPEFTGSGSEIEKILGSGSSRF